MAADAFETIRDGLAAARARRRAEVVHWADALFRDRVLERKVTAGLIAETAARRREAGPPVERVLFIDLATCGASPAAIGTAAAALGSPPFVDVVGLDVPERGSRGLLERGIAEALPRGTGRPVTVRCTFSGATARDACRSGIDWRAVARPYDWVLAIGLDGRPCRNADPGEPLGARDLAWMESATAAVVTFLDVDALAADLPLLSMTAATLDCSLIVRFDAVREGRLDPEGDVEIGPGLLTEACRCEILGRLDALATLKRRVTIRPGGDLGASGEAVEMHSPGFVTDHLLGGLGAARLVPAGALRVAVLSGAV